MNSGPNSDLNSALHQVKSCALRAHGVRSHAHNAQVVRTSRAQPVQVARSTCADRAHSAQVARIAPRSWAQVATSFPRPSLGQVTTSLPSRDLLDDQARSRRQPHVATSLLPNQTNKDATSKGVATPIFNSPGRDLKRGCDTNGQFLLLRRQNRSSAQSSRDFNLWLRPQTQPSQVTTSISGRDLKLSRPCRDIKVMSQPQIAFPRSQHEFHVTTKDPSILTSSRSRHQKDVVTPTPSF